MKHPPSFDPEIKSSVLPVSVKVLLSFFLGADGWRKLSSG